MNKKLRWVTASKRNSPATGATQGYLRLLANRYITPQYKKTGFLTGIILCTLGLLISIADALINGVNEGLLAPASAYLLPKLGLWGLILFPVFCFVVGFLLGVLIAFFFNLIGKLNGGLDIEIAEKQEKLKP